MRIIIEQKEQNRWKIIRWNPSHSKCQAEWVKEKGKRKDRFPFAQMINIDNHNKHENANDGNL